MKLSSRLFAVLVRALTVGLALATFARGQGNSNQGSPNGSNKNPDNDWAALTALATPGRTPSQLVSGHVSRANLDALTQAVERLQQTAQAAKAFYSSYPADPRAPQARKIEATSLLQSVVPSDTGLGQAAFQIAAAYRVDPHNPLKDRIGVAVLMESQQYAVTHKGQPLADNLAEYESSADRLRAEFGDAPEVYYYYLAVVDAADMENGSRVAHRIVQLPAPASAKRQAQVTIDRHAMIGTAVNLTLTAHDHHSVDLAAPGRPTVLFVWSPRHGNTQWAAQAAAARTAPNNTRWIYLALDATADEADAARKSAPQPGTHCFEAGGQPSTTGLGLKLRRVPFVYVFDADGYLTGYGRPAELAALLKKNSP